MNPDLILSGIEAIENIDVNDGEAYQKIIKGFKSMGQVPFWVLDFPYLPIEVFHCRTHDNDQLFNTFDEIEIPPARFVKSYGRCNIPGHPVFYCSENRQTSYMELLQYWLETKHDSDFYVSIGKWTIKNYLKCLVITSPDSNDRISNYDKLHGNNFDSMLQNYDTATQNSMRKFYKYMFDKFRKPAKHDIKTYMITAAYSNLAFDLPEKVDAIFYPSVPYEGNGINFAIRHDYPFKENMELTNVARNRFEQLEEDGFPLLREVPPAKHAKLNTADSTLQW